MKRKIGKILIATLLVLSLCIVLTTPVLADNQLNVSPYCQKWAPWGDDKIGNTNSRISEYGCAITSLAMILRYYEVANSDPGKVNEWLTSHEGYDGDLINGHGWKVAIQQMSGNSVQWKDRIYWADLNRLNQEIDNGYPVIIKIPYRSGSHFIVVSGRAGTTYYINDPLDGKKTTLNPATKILSLIIYHGTIPNKEISADLNCDGSVNLADSAILMSFWGKDPSGANSCQSPDINQDGNVNLTDYAIMMSQWTR